MNRFKRAYARHQASKIAASGGARCFMSIPVHVATANDRGGKGYASSLFNNLLVSNSGVADVVGLDGQGGAVAEPEFFLCLLAVAAAFVVSSSAGLGGSLVLVPALALVLGTKEGIALAALLLGSNNVVKVIAYRATLPWRKSVWLILGTIIGAVIGAALLTAANEKQVTVAVIVTIALSLVVEGTGKKFISKPAALVLAIGSGAASGFSGTSGPLKGVAVRALQADRMHTVGAASVTSLFGDVTKTAIFAEAQLLGGGAYLLTAYAIPLMVGGTFLGRRVNRKIGERGYAVLFWTVMVGYTGRLLINL